MPEAKLAGVINVTKIRGDYFSLTIDGAEFPWMTQGMRVEIQPGRDFSSITITIPANRVEIIHEA
ncbi:hypothetical protein [Streptosporangium sp. OZ121]|uniref:hypothetical protein n=1 Tax=Streptosporangium sp. OZ121 TaxID=3444183 RepID=UPI003F7B22A9